jgi:hypothetical protein
MCRKKMASWSAGPKCGNCNHAAESGRRWDEMEGRYQCAVLAPYKSGALDSRMVCFLRHRGLSPVVRVVLWIAFDFVFFSNAEVRWRKRLRCVPYVLKADNARKNAAASM